MHNVLILTEDKHGTYLILNEINKYYFSNKLSIASFYGIPHLYSYIITNYAAFNKYTKIIIVYDNAPGNNSITTHILDTMDAISALNLQRKIIFFPIICFEYEILKAKDIEYFANKKCHAHIEWLKRTSEECKSLNISNYARREPLFSDLYARVENKAAHDLKRRTGVIDKKLLSHRVTFEAMCKMLFNDAFQQWLYIGKNFGKCWEIDCCKKIKRDCNIEDTIELTSDEKKLYIIQNTLYYELIKILEAILGESTNQPKIDLAKKLIQTKQQLGTDIQKHQLNFPTNFFN